MTIEVIGTTVEVLGKTYQFKCPEGEVPALHQAAKVLQDKMNELREVNHVLSLDRLAVIAALTMTHQLLLIDTKKDDQTQKFTNRLRELKRKLESALAQNAQLELSPAE